MKPAPDLHDIAPEIARLHVLGWQPGASLSAAWWDKLGLAGWQDDYHGAARRLRAIDRLIVSRRGFPAAPLPTSLPAEATQLLSLEARLPYLLPALGFYALAQPQLLRVRRVLRSLSDVIGERAVSQLAVLTPKGRCDAALPSGRDAADFFMALGCAWMQRDRPTCPAWQGLSGKFLPPEADVPLPAHVCAFATLIRLSRLL